MLFYLLLLLKWYEALENYLELNIGGVILEALSNNKYTNRLVLFIFFTYGFVFLDRLAVTYLMPLIASDLHLNNTQVGQISMWMTLGWDFSAFLFGLLSDKSGYRKRWLVVFVLLTGVFSGLSAISTTFTSLLLLRLLNGVSEGPTAPIEMAMISAESDPRKLGRNLGFAQSGVGLIGLSLAPLVITQIATYTNWHAAFLLSSIPTLIMGLIIWKWTREVKIEKQEKKERQAFGTYLEALKYRNVTICVLISVFLMVELWIMNVFAPLFLTKVDHLSEANMGYVLSIMGLGAFFWGFIVPMISDKIGRKKTMVIFSFISVIPPLVMFFYHGSWVSLAILAFFLNVLQGLFPIFMNVIPMESVPKRLAATSSALAMGIGEIIGAAIIPAGAGALADHYGLPIVMIIAAIGPFIAAFVAFGLKESNRHISGYEIEKSAV